MTTSEKTRKLRRISEVMGMIVEDTEKDVKHYEGAAFTGRNVSEMHGKLSASVQALANAIKVLVDEELLKKEKP